VLDVVPLSRLRGTGGPWQILGEDPTLCWPRQALREMTRSRPRLLTGTWDSPRESPTRPALCFYLWKTILPLRLSPIYPEDRAPGLLSPAVPGVLAAVRA